MNKLNNKDYRNSPRVFDAQTEYDKVMEFMDNPELMSYPMPEWAYERLPTKDEVEAFWKQPLQEKLKWIEENF